MPTYTVTACVPGLSQEAKQSIATQITSAHHLATGAQKFFAEVIFRDVDTADFFIGGKPLKGESIYIHGHIRAGRTVTQKQSLMTQIVKSVAVAAAVPERSIWVYLSDIPAEQMLEFGHILPLPGKEGAWFNSLPEDDKRYLTELGS